MITRYIKGDIRDTELKYIAHGVNCQNTMGSVVARALLGKVIDVPVEEDKVIFNMFTQLRYGYDDQRYVNYGAIAKCFEAIDRMEKVYRLAIPKIGCGLAGGDWGIVKEIIDDCTPNTEIWVYELNGSDEDDGEVEKE